MGCYGCRLCGCLKYRQLLLQRGDLLMRMLILVTICVVLMPLLLPACIKPPEALMTVNTNNGQAPFTVTFTNQSLNADQFQWDFGDGTNIVTDSVEESVTHDYTKAGEHSVILKAIKNSKPEITDTMTLLIKVDPGSLDLVILEPAKTTVEAGQELQFSALSFDRFNNPITDLNYAFRCSPSSIGHIYNSGKFVAENQINISEGSVTVTVKQGDITKTASAELTLQPGPLDAIEIQPDNIVMNKESKQKFNATGLDKYGNKISNLDIQWEVSGGSIDQTGIFKDGIPGNRYEVRATVVSGNRQVTGTATIGIPPTFIRTGNMIDGRRDHKAFLLPSGKVLIIGGTSRIGALLYDPVKGVFSDPIQPI